jgi:hypothetical protein
MGRRGRRGQGCRSKGNERKTSDQQLFHDARSAIFLLGLPGGELANPMVARMSLWPGLPAKVLLCAALDLSAHALAAHFESLLPVGNTIGALILSA